MIYKYEEKIVVEFRDVEVCDEHHSLKVLFWRAVVLPVDMSRYEFLMVW